MKTLNAGRFEDFRLVGMAALILVTGALVVGLAAGRPDPAACMATFGVAGGYFAVWAVLRATGRRGDPLLLPLAAVLTSFGLIFILRLRPDLFHLQALWAGIGLTAFLAAAFGLRDLARVAEYKYVVGAVGVGLLVATMAFGVDVGGNRNWLVFGPARVQPAEFAKIFIVLFFAAYLRERGDILFNATVRYGPFSLPHPRVAAPLLTVWGLAMVMLVFQRDLGAALLYFGSSLLMVYMAGGRFAHVGLGAGLFLAGAAGAYLLYPHVAARIDIWLNPWADPTGRSYQIVQSLFALGSGGMLGSGLRSGHPGMIPEAHTDFIFAAVGEEMGLMGAAAVMILYLLLVYRAFRAALSAADPFLSLTAGGLAAFTALQVFVIVGGVTKFLPLTGITLPYISYGGSSLVSNFLLLGILYTVSEAGPPDA